MLSYGVARAVRYGLLAWLGMTYGRWFVRMWEKELTGWTAPVLWTYGALVVAGIGYGVWKFRRGRQRTRLEVSPAKGAA
jgi:hypothetical protein